MEKLYELLRGTVRLEVVGAEPEKLLTACALKGIEFWNCDPGDGCVMHMTVYAAECPAVEKLARRCMCEVQTIQKKGGEKLLRMVRRRKLLAALLAFLLPSSHGRRCTSGTSTWRGTIPCRMG